MARTATQLEPLSELLETSNRPVYAVDPRLRIAYCNAALAKWLDLRRNQIVGRLVEYHSEPADGAPPNDAQAPLTDLCPPPRALAGEPCVGTISCLGRDGRLIHRTAQFIPLDATKGQQSSRPSKSGLLVVLSVKDLTPQELAGHVAGELPADELHRTIRQFRRTQAARYAVQSLLGESPAMRKLRAQVAAAAISGANALIYGDPGSGRGHVARAIHYRAAGDADVRLVPVDGNVANDDVLRRAVDAVRSAGSDSRQRPTLLLENLDRLGESQQSHLAEVIAQGTFAARVIATCCRHTPSAATQPTPRIADTSTDDTSSVPATLYQPLLDAVSTITVEVPPLRERIDDLPILAQFFLEAANRDRGKQVGSLRPDALDHLALHNWPGELTELRQVIFSAHNACRTHEITPADLPPVVHHASKSAASVRRQPERIVLDELLANIERAAIERALAQTGGNKSEAAEFLGMTRPRLYRRLVQLGLAGPEFVERDPDDDAP